MNQFCLVPNTPYMPANKVFADVFLRKMKGGSQSSLVSTSDGKFYVLKLANNPQGPNTLFNEAFGSILAHHLGLPVPEWSPINLDHSFIVRNPNLSCTSDGRVCAPSPGLHFGSSFINGSRDEEVYEIVPHGWMERIENPQFFAGMLLLDVWTENVDRRQALFIERSGSRALKVIFLDHGHMFRGPNGDKGLKSARSCLYYHRHIYARALKTGNIQSWLSRIEALNERILQPMIERIPLEWRNDALEKQTIALLLRNQRNLRQKAREISGVFLN
jgi:hypothetical protein